MAIQVTDVGNSVSKNSYTSRTRSRTSQKNSTIMFSRHSRVSHGVIFYFCYQSIWIKQEKKENPVYTFLFTRTYTMPKKRKVKGGSNTSNNSNTTSSSNSNPRNSSLTTQSRSSSDTNSRRGTRLSARKPKKRISDAYTEDYNLRNSLETSTW